MKLTLNNYRPVSNNKVQRMHWTKRRKLKEEVDWLVCCAVAKKPPLFSDRAKIHFDVYLSTARKFDPDNFLGGSGKWILDALKNENIIADDSHQNVELSVDFHKDSKRPRVEIEIERLEG